jgi:hypothetical protein
LFKSIPDSTGPRHQINAKAGSGKNISNPQHYPFDYENNVNPTPIRRKAFYFLGIQLYSPIDAGVRIFSRRERISNKQLPVL